MIPPAGSAGDEWGGSLKGWIAGKRRCCRSALRIGSTRTIPRFDSVQPAATGRSGYNPGVLLKLYIYGYLNRVQSSRRLECEAGRNLEVMWLTGRLAPDHKTVADFRKDNGPANKKVCA
jgi:transposase